MCVCVCVCVCVFRVLGRREKTICTSYMPPVVVMDVEGKEGVKGKGRSDAEREGRREREREGRKRKEKK